MLSKFVAIIFITLLAPGFSLAADDFDLLKEKIGDLRINLPEKVVTKSIPCRLTRGAIKYSHVDGQYHQTWKYSDCGISLDMASGKKGGSKSITSIELSYPGILQTKLGIRIGSTEQEVHKAYGRYMDKDSSRPGENFVAGSVFGGLMFSFKNGRVSGIFLGAAAE
jgi:hypothetical protein